MLNIGPIRWPRFTSVQSGVTPRAPVLRELHVVAESADALNNAYDILCRDGVLSIPMTEETSRYLQARMNLRTAVEPAPAPISSTLARA
jgi:hypothetical protein